MTERIARFRAVNLGETIAEQGRTKRWVAGRAGIHETLLSHFIAGRRTVPAPTAERISEALGVPIFLLFVSADQNHLSASEAA
jgi:plasmid maintenance system antidote protein VapI